MLLHKVDRLLCGGVFIVCAPSHLGGVFAEKRTSYSVAGMRPLCQRRRVLLRVVGRSPSIGGALSAFRYSHDV